MYILYIRFKEYVYEIYMEYKLLHRITKEEIAKVVWSYLNMSVSAGGGGCPMSLWKRKIKDTIDDYELSDKFADRILFNDQSYRSIFDIMYKDMGHFEIIDTPLLQRRLQYDIINQ